MAESAMEINKPNELRKQQVAAINRPCFSS